MLESLQEDQLEPSRPRWTIGNDGEQGKIVFPESFNGVIATEVILILIVWKILYFSTSLPRQKHCDTTAHVLLRATTTRLLS